MIYIKLNNVDSHRFENAEIEQFKTIDYCIKSCYKNNYTGFVIYKKSVYYRNIYFESLIRNYIYLPESIMYIIIPDVYKKNIFSNDFRVQFYTKGISNKTYDFTNDRYKMSLPELENKIDNFIPGNKNHTNQIYENLYIFLLKYNLSKNIDFKLNPYDLSWGQNDATFVKSRPKINSLKSILLPLEYLYLPFKVIHLIKEDIHFDKKQNKIVWRGTNSGVDINHDVRASRVTLVSKYYNNSLCDIGFSDMRYKKNTIEHKNVKDFIKKKLSIKEQLNSKFIVSPEGNDFATNLLWILLSNSIPICPIHFIETWSMESLLEPWKHYIPVKNDYSDLIRNYTIAINNNDICNDILFNKKLFMSNFLDKDMEMLVINKTINTYFNNRIH